MQKLKGAHCTMAQSAQQDQDTKAPPAPPASVPASCGGLYAVLVGLAVFRVVGGDYARSHAPRA